MPKNLLWAKDGVCMLGRLGKGNFPPGGKKFEGKQGGHSKRREDGAFSRNGGGRGKTKTIFRGGMGGKGRTP